MTDQSDLTTTLGKLTLKNPFMLASAPPTASVEHILRGFRAGWGGAVIKTIHPDGMAIRDVSPRFAAWKGAGGELLGFENIELLSKKSVSYWEAGIGQIREEFPDRILIASIMGDPDPKSWQELAGTVQDAGCDAIELNVSCPHGMPEAGVGAAIGQNPPLVNQLTRSVVKSVKVPVYVKMTPNITDITLPAKAAAAGGAAGISAINSVQSLCGVDIETFGPHPSVDGMSTHGGYSGPAIKPIGLGRVAAIAGCIDLPVMGIGGVSTWQDAVEYLLLGASAVQVCTAVMWNGYGIVKEMNRGLVSYLAWKGFSSPDELRGLGLRQLTAHQSLSRDVRIRPVITDAKKCDGCGRCVVACRDGGYGAIRLVKKKPIIDPAACDGCGLCILVCPSGALGALEDQ
ncbi:MULTISPECIES: NAD-dependent dihydropyrimidine dehydrogenase subunit PreA [unclassified Methanoregula]|uniref:NAD-dependent dihydropyrimidine dehydrogenase subunit PreA n=1 Tax=unclassified Methanoregula TaxID=2649730 RepID=UPI0009CEB8CB|nr:MULTISPECIES: NAD-dependent dihydropyrimidine dehydrogenase subunit PreA [unclassified Methanoregula]OPX62858.1 MAG: Heterodisulfide reductase subunit A-like protein [Methanoregula sp. PtaB.Bin085]OPY35295.1 MAG: Heterodisulfide reductase subunit A-like protein [Methanoregula sp. PtaU1.Bin006]